MCQPSLSVWFVCRLCRGSFGQVDAFIEHKKEKHFTQFQNTTSIVFEERELGEQCSVIIKVENQPVDENDDPRIKTELNNEDVVIPFNSEVVKDPNLCVFELKSEPITYESEINPDSENHFRGLEQREQNPYVLLKRLTSEEIQRACVSSHHSTLLKCGQKNFVSNLESSSSSADIDYTNCAHIKVEKSTEIQTNDTALNISKEHDLQFECKLCTKQLESAAQLKIHVGICALYHEDRNRFCVICNRKFCDPTKLKDHRLRFHGTEEEKSSLYKFKCHICPKIYRRADILTYHLEYHKQKEEEAKILKSKPFKCLHSNCGKEFRFNSKLQSHIATHVGIRPFSCSFLRIVTKGFPKGAI